MMVFTMNCLKKSKFLFFIILLNFLIIQNLYANQILLKNFVVEKFNDDYKLSFDQKLTIEGEILQALQKGIALRFNIIVKLININNFWFDKIIFKEKNFYEIKYRNLLRKYELKDLSGSLSYFSTLEDLKSSLKKVNFELGNLTTDSMTEITVNIELDKNQLPKPLQINYGNDSWNISSENYLMKFEEIK